MITVYKRKHLPKETQIITVNDVYFNKNTVELLDDRAKDIIKKIDNSEMVSQYSVLSRFDNMMMNIDKISTGCKTILNVLYNPDTIFDIRECGDNALDIIYSLSEGKIYCDYPLISFDIDKVSVYENGKTQVVDTYESLKEWWEE